MSSFKSKLDIKLHVWEGMVHCFPLLAPMFPEATRAWEETPPHYDI